jgi:transcriptional regulator with XRE-family HTH domain
MTTPRLLHDIRKTQGLGQVVLANTAGVSQGTVSAIERGATVPTLTVQTCLAQALGVDASEIVWPTKSELPMATLRRSRGLSIRRLARIVGADHRRLSAAEAGHRSIPLDVAQRVALELGAQSWEEIGVDVELTLEAAAKRYHVAPRNLKWALTKRLIRGWRRQGGHQGGHRAFVFRDSDLRADLARYRCNEPGCERHGLSPSGGCEKHGGALLARGRKRPGEVCRNIARGKKGGERPDQRDRMREDDKMRGPVSRANEPRWRPETRRRKNGAAKLREVRSDGQEKKREKQRNKALKVGHRSVALVRERADSGRRDLQRAVIEQLMCEFVGPSAVYLDPATRRQPRKRDDPKYRKEREVIRRALSRSHEELLYGQQELELLLGRS